MILSYRQIEAETRSKWGGNANKIMAGLLTRSLDDLEAFIGSVFRIFPQLGVYEASKASTIDYTKEHVCTHHEADKAFSPQQISGIERSFRNMFGDTKANDLLNMAERWQTSMMAGDLVGKDGYWSSGYYAMLNDSFQESYKELFSIWEELKKRKKPDLVPPLPLVVNDGAAFIEKIYKEGYQRVTSKVTQVHLPSIQQIMVDGMKSGKAWTEIAAELNSLGGAEAYHWTRLVRSEMINASQEAKIQQALESEDVNIIWRASRMGATCKICEERNGKIFDPRKMGDAAYFATDETGKIDTNKEVKIGRYPHPQCRCSFSYTVMDVDWKQ